MKIIAYTLLFGGALAFVICNIVGFYEIDVFHTFGMSSRKARHVTTFYGLLSIAPGCFLLMYIKVKEKE